MVKKMFAALMVCMTCSMAAAAQTRTAPVVPRPGRTAAVLPRPARTAPAAQRVRARALKTTLAPAASRAKKHNKRARKRVKKQVRGLAAAARGRR
jgi:hypothetical protein